MNFGLISSENELRVTSLATLAKVARIFGTFQSYNKVFLNDFRRFICRSSCLNVVCNVDFSQVSLTNSTNFGGVF